MYYNRDDPEILHSLDFIRQRGYVARYLMPEGYERYFQEQARYLSAHTSTAIEGNPIGQTMAMIVLIEGADPEKPAEVEKVNLEAAYEFVAWLSQDQTMKIDQGIIRTLNSIALKDLPAATARRRGMYRPGAAVIVDSDTRRIRYRPPAAEEIPSLMDDLIGEMDRWRREEAGPVAAAMAHFGIISIHPFEDGNGRTARLIADMILDLTGWSVGGALSANMVILDRRLEYYNSLRSVQGDDFEENVDITGFVKFHCSALAQGAANLEEKVVWFKQRRDLLIAEPDGLNPRQVTALMFMHDLGPLSTSMYAKLSSSSQSSALTDLAYMIERGLVVREGAGPSTRYKLSERVWTIFQEDENEAEQVQPPPAIEEPEMERSKTPGAGIE